MTVLSPSAAPFSALPSRAGTPSVLRLDQLPRHTPATVVAVEAGASEEDAERVMRLTEIGFVPGERVRVVACGFPGREPLAVRIGNTTFALRRHEAAMVQVVAGGGA